MTDEATTEHKTLAEVERDYILKILAICENNRTRASGILNIGRNTLIRKLKIYQTTNKEKAQCNSETECATSDATAPSAIQSSVSAAVSR